MLFVICDETTGPKYLVWEVSRHQILCGEKFKVNTSAELHCVTIAISGSHCHNNTTKYLHTQQFYKYLNNFDKKQVKKVQTNERKHHHYIHLQLESPTKHT